MELDEAWNLVWSQKPTKTETVRPPAKESRAKRPDRRRTTLRDARNRATGPERRSASECALSEIATSDPAIDTGTNTRKYRDERSRDALA